MTLLIQKSELLEECFGVKITENGELKSLPQLIEGYPYLGVMTDSPTYIAIAWSSSARNIAGNS